MANLVVTGAGGFVSKYAGDYLEFAFGMSPLREASLPADTTVTYYTNRDQTVATVLGSGFTYNANGVPVGGVVMSVTVNEPGNPVPLVQIVDANVALTAFDSAWTAPLLGSTGNALWGALAHAAPIARGWTSASFLPGSPDADLYYVGSFVPGTIEPGRPYALVTIGPGAGNDAIRSSAFVFVENPDAMRLAGTLATNAVEVSYANDSGGNGAIFNFAGDQRTWSILDPYGDTDIVATVVGGARMTANDDLFLGGRYAEFIAGLAGNDFIDAGAGFDTVRYDLDERYGGAAAVYVDLAAGQARDGFGDTDTLVGIENVIGTNRDSTTMAGGSDTLLGNELANIMTGLRGADYIDGCGGLDMAEYARDAENGGGAAVYVNLGLAFGRDGWGDYDVLLSIEQVRGTNAGTPVGDAPGDVLVGDDGDNLFQGLGGVDVIDGSGGLDTGSYEADLAFGGMYGVVVDLAAGEALDGFGDGDVLVSIENIVGTNRDQRDTPGVGDILLGSDEANVIEGLAGNDFLDGRGGNDILRSGPGNDVMTGGPGIDIFEFDYNSVPTFSDTITDFESGIDRISIAAGWADGPPLRFTAVEGGILVDRDAIGTKLTVLGATSAQQILDAFINYA